MTPDQDTDDRFTPEEFAEMEEAEWEITNQYDLSGPEWGKFVATASDEEIVRTYLASRMPLWHQLPYDWMDLNAEELDSWNLCGWPVEVGAAYRRTRSDPSHRSIFEKDYGHDDAMEKWVEALEKEAQSVSVH